MEFVIECECVVCVVFNVNCDFVIILDEDLVKGLNVY